MDRLASQQILALWEFGSHQPPVQRALTLLAYGLQNHTLDQLAQSPLGIRNQYLLQLRQQMFGSQMACVLPCQQCKEFLEFTLNAQQLLNAVQTEGKGNDQPRLAKIADYELHYRSVNSQDIETILAQSVQNTYAALERALLARCLLAVKRNKQSIDFLELPVSIIDAFIAQLEQSDPLAEIKIELACPACQFSWQGLFDIASFFWEELEHRAQQLLAEVHQLAVTYGWTEEAILALTPARKRYYLERIRQ